MASGNVPPQRREVVVRGDGNCFYRAIALWRDEMTDEKHEEIRRLSSTLIEKNPKVFQPLLFSSNSVKDHVKKSMITGTWAETVDIFSCASLLSDRFAPSRRHRKSGLLLNRLCSLIHVHQSQQKSNAGVQSL